MICEWLEVSHGRQRPPSSLEGRKREGEVSDGRPRPPPSLEGRKREVEVSDGRLRPPSLEGRKREVLQIWSSQATISGNG